MPKCRSGLIMWLKEYATNDAAGVGYVTGVVLELLFLRNLLTTAATAVCLSGFTLPASSSFGDMFCVEC